MIVLFYPDSGALRKGHSLCKQRIFCEYLGIGITNNPDADFDAAVYLNLNDVNKPDKIILEIAKRVPIINLFCNNLDRFYIEEIFIKVFGYSSFAEPGERCVRKGNYQGGGHHSIFATCPDSQDGKYIYQKFIDGSINDDTIRVIRPVIFGRKVKALIVKESDSSNIFEQNEVIKKEYFYSPQSDWIFYSDYEIKQIEKFVDILCLDYGELDVIRDKDNRIYVIDVNNIPGSKVFERLKNSEYALGTMAKEFAKLLK